MRPERLADLDVQVVDAQDVIGAPVVVLMHGFSMGSGDLAPFGASMGLPGVFLFPDGPLDVSGQGAPRPQRAWWRIDTRARDAAVAAGIDRDLSDEVPSGLPAARDRLMRLLGEVQGRWPGRPLFLGGFSQGAILSLDTVLRTGVRPAGLILLSGARVDAAATTPLLDRVRGLPIIQSHGRADRELSFRAAQSLAETLAGAGADLTWLPFDGGHEIPLPVLRDLKKFIRKNSAR